MRQSGERRSVFSRYVHDLDRRLVLVLVAYLSAVASVASYVVFNAGQGDPTRLQILLITVPVIIIYHLAMKFRPR